MQNWKYVCSSKVLVLVTALVTAELWSSFTLHSVNDNFGLPIQIKHSITRQKLEVGGRVSHRVFKLYFKSSYTVLVKTGQAHSTSHLLPEMQDIPQQQVVPLKPALDKWPILLPVLNKNKLLLLSSAFHKQTQIANSSVLIVMLGKPSCISTGWLAPVICSSVTVHGHMY